MVRPANESLNSLIEVLSDWNALLQDEDIDFESLPNLEDFERPQPFYHQDQLKEPRKVKTSNMEVPSP